MRVAIAGAGAVGRSIAGELLENGHSVMLIERDPDKVEPARVARAEWLTADAAELASLEEAQLQDCDVVISATGDDKVNLVSRCGQDGVAVRVVARSHRTTSCCSPRPGAPTRVSTPRCWSPGEAAVRSATWSG